MATDLLLKYHPMNWPRFWRSRRVQAMSSSEVRGIYSLFLGVMWENGGWLPLNHAFIAGKLQMDVRRWKARYMGEIIPTCIQTSEFGIGIKLTHEVVNEVWADVQKRIADNHKKTEGARAKLAAKRGKTTPVTEQAAAPVTEAVTGQVKAHVTASVTEHSDGSVTAGKEKEKKISKQEREERNVGDYRGPSPPRAGKQDMVDHLGRSLQRALQEEREQAGGHIDHDRNDEPKRLEHRDQGRKAGDAGGPMDLTAIANTYRSHDG